MPALLVGTAGALGTSGGGCEARPAVATKGLAIPGPVLERFRRPGPCTWPVRDPSPRQDRGAHDPHTHSEQLAATSRVGLACACVGQPAVSAPKSRPETSPAQREGPEAARPRQLRPQPALAPRLHLPATRSATGPREMGRAPRKARPPGATAMVCEGRRVERCLGAARRPRPELFRRGPWEVAFVQRTSHLGELSMGRGQPKTRGVRNSRCPKHEKMLRGRVSWRTAHAGPRWNSVFLTEGSAKFGRAQPRGCKMADG